MTTGHLSDYALDALAAGRTTPEKAAHLAGCPACQARWAQLEEADARTRLAGRFGTTRQYVLRDGAASRRRRRFKLFVAAPLAAAAIAAIAIFQPTFGRLRPDRREPMVAAARPTPPLVPALEVVRVEGPGPVRPGNRLVFNVTGAGARRALVMGFDDTGAVSQIWPANGDRSGVLSSVRRTVLTPGSWAPWKSTRVEVFLSDEPLVASQVRELFAKARAEQPGTPVRSLALGPLPGQLARLSSFVEVQRGLEESLPVGSPR